MATFALVDDRPNFPKDEEKTLAYWTDIKAFETSLKKSEGRPLFTFYDGPPFATGLPHYGHILAGTIKDVVTRYAHQTGHYVERRFGWDCHGLPVEYEIDKKLGIKSKEDIARMGIARYNAECRAIVQRYSKEWEDTVKRMGRWIDFKNDYKTLDTSFMETVWWVFKQMNEKGLVYQGFKVMPFSTTCTTPLSNFESNQNMKDVLDPAVVVSFPVLPHKEYSLLAWTTTPWTLPSNLGLCVNKDFDYVKVKDVATGNLYVMAKCRLCQMYPAKKGKKKAAPKKEEEKKKEPANRHKKKGKSEVTEAEPLDSEAFEIVEEMKGSALAGLKYEPLFDYFADEAKNGAFIVMTDDYVMDSSGTGIVHQAPAFGEDDYRVCLAHGVIQRGDGIICPVDDNGNFTDDVTDFAGRYVKEADRDIIRLLTKRGRLIQNKQITHAYPFCWRSDTPLIYRAVPSWFINVPKIKEKLLANNMKTYWVPKAVQEKRFHNWLQDARDWSVSRNRYWGTPIPIWMSEDGKEWEVIGSVAELEERSGVTGITDLHRDKIDHITIPSKNGNGVLRRVPEVFDCWFESGSMPYAQVHYPFENKEKFEQGFPADFIAEGLDQTRGWFYTLMVISTALYDKPPFKNLVVNGLVLAEDGKKMSKRLKNYPEPHKVVDENGADALRLYLINSPVVRAEKLEFKEENVREVVRNIFIPWYNVYRFFISSARRWHKDTGKVFKPDSKVHTKTTNSMDLWILSSLQTLIKNVKEEMRKYYLSTVIPNLIHFIDQLSKWYVRMNKNRLKGDQGEEECELALCTLYHVLFDCCRIMAPFTPFITENMYQNLKVCLPKEEQEDSVHYLMIPDVDETAINTDIERSVSTMQTVVDLGRQAREKANISLRMPIPSVTIVDSNTEVLDDCKSLQQYIKSELNSRDLVLESKSGDYVSLSLVPDRRVLGKRLGKAINPVLKFVAKMTYADIIKFQEVGKVDVDVDGTTITVEAADCSIGRTFSGDTKKLEAQSSVSTLLIMSKELDADCKAEGLARDVMSCVQQLRKKAGLSVEEKVRAWYEVDSKDTELLAVLTNKADFIQTGIRVAVNNYNAEAKAAKEITKDTTEFGKKGQEHTITIYLTK